MRFGRETCMWGRAVYFAFNASYSNSYSYRNGLERQMFLGEVLLGDFIALPQQNLVKPPNKIGTTIEYDSV